jgi:hypothetical protein
MKEEVKYLNRFNPKFSDNSSYEFTFGNFDPWCVEYYKGGKAQKRITDTTSFKALLRYGKHVGYENVYKDFVEVYDMVYVGTDLNEVTRRIELISEKYGVYQLKMNKLLHFLFMCIVAEEMKEKTKLGKRIKRLGVHRVLIEGIDPEIAAKETNRVWPKKISYMCEMRGF